MNTLEYLERVLKPEYVGWKDQYKAIINALGIDPDEPYENVVYRNTLADKEI